jgi:two-component sensor histidine kinase
LNVELELEGTPQAPAEARQVLDGFSDRVPERRLRDVRLLVSELVTNAVRHAGLKAGDRIGLLVHLRDSGLRVEVAEPDPARASGWGLYLVDELADRWGMDRGGRGGTRIWFELDGAWFQTR